MMHPSDAQSALTVGHTISVTYASTQSDSPVTRAGTITAKTITPFGTVFAVTGDGVSDFEVYPNGLVMTDARLLSVRGREAETTVAL